VDGERLQKVLAAAGVGSRRVCDQLIADGRVTVDGKVAVLGTRVDPQTAVIHVDGTRIPTRAGHVVLALHKPRGVASAMTDQKGLPCVGDYVADRPERVFHVGRLDVDTEGLLLMTNDGELANRIAHPSHGVSKTYVATVRWPGGSGSACPAAQTGATSTTARSASMPAGSSRWRMSAAWWRCRCTRGATGSCGGSSTPSAIRCSAWCAPRWAR
jgi:16S rRNA U516 pseudouridylate synthase RsuA-like enzyme